MGRAVRRTLMTFQITDDHRFPTVPRSGTTGPYAERDAMKCFREACELFGYRMGNDYGQ